jgi:hypothetical protein
MVKEIHAKTFYAFRVCIHHKVLQAEGGGGGGRNRY